MIGEDCEDQIEVDESRTEVNFDVLCLEKDMLVIKENKKRECEGGKDKNEEYKEGKK